MGRNSKQRRAAKRRRQDQRGATHRQATGRAAARSDGDSGAAESICDCTTCLLKRMLSIGNIDIADAEPLLLSLVAQVWRLGWQPREVVRQIERVVSPVRPGRQLVNMAIAAESELHGNSAIDPRWSAQVQAIANPAPCEPTQPGWVRRWATDIGSLTAARVCGAVARDLAMLTPLLMLIPPPGVSAADVAKWSDLVGWEVDVNEVADPVLTKVRALLAKAEATEFPEEAEAFTAKAHALMVQHAVDDAAVRGGTRATPSHAIAARRFAVAEPYAKQHLLLLSNVASAAGGRCVFHANWAMATVVASRRDLARIDAMHTSLMVQSQTAFNIASRRAAVGSPERSRGFRSSFLTAYAHRVGQRLRAQHDLARQSAPGDALPVLATDRDAVNERYEVLFGGPTRSMSFGAPDAAGWDAGRSAADSARLGSDEVPGVPVRRLTA